MGTKTEGRAGGKPAKGKGKSKPTPKFLLVVNDEEPSSGEDEAATERAAGDRAAAARDEAHQDADWPERVDIRDGLVDQVTARFGIPPEIAKRAINDMLRLG